MKVALNNQGIIIAGCKVAVGLIILFKKLNRPDEIFIEVMRSFSGEKLRLPEALKNFR